MEPITDTPTTTDAGTGKADLVKRFVAVFIDGIISAVIAGIFSTFGALLSGIGLLLAAGYTLVRDGLTLDFANGRSIGKHIMKLTPVRLDGGTMDINTSIRRNWPLALSSLISAFGYFFGGMSLIVIGAAVVLIGQVAGLLGLVEGILVLTDNEGRRIGDKMAGTKVVDGV